MSGKRTAGRELNHDNWNDEEEGEEVGEFKKANDAELQKRVRKIAKRRIAGDSDAPPNANPFSGFGGFQTNTGMTTSSPVSSASAFSFLSKIPSAVSAPKTNGNSEAASEKSSQNIEYLSKVKALNVALADWIKKQVDENPICLLTPIFKDYEKYLKEFEELKITKKDEISKPKEVAPTASASFTFGVPSKPASSLPMASTTNTSTPSNVFNSFKFGGSAGSDPHTTSSASPSKVNASEAVKTNNYSFGSPSTQPQGISFGTIAATESKGITFGAAQSENQGILFGTKSTASAISFGSTPAPATSTFSFGFANSSTPSFGGFGGSSFGNAVAPPKTDAQTEEAEDEEPPKNEFVPVVEDDSLYSKRCKVFVKGASDYNDRGVGTLYIKKVDASKIQMIVRADTNLGNIIFNIMIVEGLPVSRMGKNNVMVVCIPTPDAKPPPTSVLLRVKTGEEADELLETINKYKK